MLSGLFPYPDKPSIFIGGMPSDRKLELAELVHFPLGKVPVGYRGVPLIAGWLSHVDCLPLVESAKAKMADWKGRILSYVERMQLIKSVLQGGYIFWTGLFGLPARTIWNLESLFSHFL
ncbi:hypothetical protein NE237_020040 [Protea cynaroides]|uniref:Uncharacterized protein n=1 Tax=Protea cynaroides TaxID=273540 RepID=A0A9Q0H8N6_9MAGN|nr:hypothetical protein NE237_020040 [Protea cynaroides]